MPWPLNRSVGRVDVLPGRRRLAVWIAAAACLTTALVGMGVLLAPNSRPDRTRTYRIGYGRDAPFHFRGTDGQPTGLAVELVREAARRRGFTLQWVEAESMAADRLDLWVLMTRRPERRLNLHLTEPFLQTHTCFLVPDSSPIRNPEDLRHARISFLDFGIHRRNLAQLAPEMRPLPTDSAVAALRAVATGEADAAYLDEYAALPALLQGAAGAIPMRNVPARIPKSEMGLAALPTLAPVADEIREEMHAMTLDGTLLGIAEKWGFFPNLTADQIVGVEEMRRRLRWLTVGITTLGILLGVVAVLAVWAKRQALRLQRMQAQLRVSESQLRQAQKMEAVGQLAGGVAHDFNNLLAATLLNVNLLQSKPGLDPETREGLKEIETSANRATNLTRQLLLFGRRSVLEPRPIHLEEMVDGLLRMLGRLLGAGIQLHFERAPRPSPVEADAGMLEQVLVNLVVNARDAMPDGGLIRILTGSRTFTDADVGLHPSRRLGSFAFLTVADSGTGMTESTLGHIFEPFFTTKAPGKGTGLGLATVHGIIAQHHGWVEVESKQGQGSRFTVFLPTTTLAPISSPNPNPVESIPRGHETVLVAEDDPELRRPLVQMLRDLGYRVLEAGNGPVALALWQQHPNEVALLLTDMVMPEGMNGRALAERLRAERPDLPVIISSGFSADMLETASPPSNGFAQLPKPYSRPQLARFLREVLEGRHHGAHGPIPSESQPQPEPQPES